MIVADMKPMEEIVLMTRRFNRMVLLGCGGCVAVCLAGGLSEAQRLAGLLHMLSQNEGRTLTLQVLEVERQCDEEFLQTVDELAQNNEAILSLGCGAGVQLLAQRYEHMPVLPAVNTTFLGASGGLGVWNEMCRGCGDCLLEHTGGICPVTRCAKSHFNGPCGGNRNGVCEVGGGINDCAWQLIYERLRARGQLDTLREIYSVRNWQTAQSGGVRKRQSPDFAGE